MNKLFTTLKQMALDAALWGMFVAAQFYGYSGFENVVGAYATIMIVVSLCLAKIIDGQSISDVASHIEKHNHMRHYYNVTSVIESCVLLYYGWWYIGICWVVASLLAAASRQQRINRVLGES